LTLHENALHSWVLGTESDVIKAFVKGVLSNFYAMREIFSLSSAQHHCTVCKNINFAGHIFRTNQIRRSSSYKHQLLWYEWHHKTAYSLFVLACFWQFFSVFCSFYFFIENRLLLLYSFVIYFYNHSIVICMNLKANKVVFEKVVYLVKKH